MVKIVRTGERRIDSKRGSAFNPKRKTLPEGGSSVLSEVEGVYGVCDVGEHLLDRLFAVDFNEESSLGIEVEERPRLGVKHLKTVCDGSLGVIAASFPVSAALKSIVQFLFADSQVDDGLE